MSPDTSKRTPAAVKLAAVGAALCTAYSADMSWRFAAEKLGMTHEVERAFMFAVAEFALLVLANMARHNVRTTGTAGTPGTLVWVVTLVQIVPAFTLYALLPASVRAFFGPVLAALLWHLAMGIELRHSRGEQSSAFLAVLGRELRERMLSWLGLARRGRDAAQLTRDRWTVRAADLATAATYAKPGSRRERKLVRRLEVAVARAEVARYPGQRDALLAELSARRNAKGLTTVELPSPWESTPDRAMQSTPDRAMQSTPDRDPTEHPPTETTRSRADQPEHRPAVAAAVDPDRSPTVTIPTTRPKTARHRAQQARPKTPRRVPTAARSTRPKRSLDELVEAARQLPEDDQRSAERLRKTLNCGAPRAREVRDRLDAQRAVSELNGAVR